MPPRCRLHTAPLDSRGSAATSADNHHRPRANAFFYDDTPANFQGAGPRGRHPAVECIRLSAPLSIEQLAHALGVFQRAEAAKPDMPVPFFFFDFDGTLTLQDGLLRVDGGGKIEALFGNYERRRTLQAVLGTLLQGGQCYVLTANAMTKRVEEALNALLASGGAKPGMPCARFGVTSTVRYVPAGAKLKEIEAIVAERDFVLVPSVPAQNVGAGRRPAQGRATRSAPCSTPNKAPPRPPQGAGSSAATSCAILAPNS